jgi:hypothetical protein
VIANWPERGDSTVQDFWKKIKTATRTFCKGWGANRNNQIKKEKSELLRGIKNLDMEVERGTMGMMQWQQRYELEQKLEEIYRFEEIQWQRRGGVNWILKGDSNSCYFRNKANGRKKNCTIFALEEGDKEIRENIIRICLVLKWRDQ